MDCGSYILDWRHHSLDRDPVETLIRKCESATHPRYTQSAIATSAFDLLAHSPSETSSHPSIHTLQVNLHSTLLLSSERHGTGLDHERHDFVENVSRSHRGQLCIGVICRRDFDDIGGGEVDTLETTDDRADLTGRPSASLWGTSTRSKCRVNGVDIDREVNWRVLACTKRSVSSANLRNGISSGYSPTRSWIFLMMPAVPMVSISLASTISNPT